jgi:hypothetical protein
MKYMKKLILWMPAVALLMTGCGSIVSVSPLYSDETITQNPGLIGTWQASTGDDILLVRAGDNKTYQALYTSMKDSASTMLFQVQLVKLQGTLYADLVRDTSGWAIPGHAFAQISLSGDTLSVSFLDSDWLKQEILSERPAAAGLNQGNLLILPDSTAALQQMVSKYADDPRAIDGGAEFQRLH